MSSIDIARLDTGSPEFDQQLHQKIAWEDSIDPKVQATVREILDAVRTEGDAAVLRYTASLDRLDAASVSDLRVSGNVLTVH